jgi:hypothetical protein
MRVDVLFEQIPEESWMKLYWRLQDCLEECRQAFLEKRRQDVEEVFDVTTDRINFTPTRGVVGDEAWTAGPIQRSYKLTRSKQLEDYLRDY